jgi:CRP-like cAMP-binding protein
LAYKESDAVFHCLAVEGTHMKEGVRSGERANSEGKVIRNRIVLGLPDEEYQRLQHCLEFVELPHHFSMHEPGRKLRCAYFLNCGLASIVVCTRDGGNVEAGVTGCEGFVGTALIASMERSPLREQMQIAGEGFRVKAGALEKALAESPRLRSSLTRYAVLQGLQVAQTAACNRLHGVRERLARWLLLAQDRLGTPTVPITQDFLATMLGTDRPTVTLAARRLQAMKAIEYRRGVVSVRSRRRLEAAACECYGVIRQFDGELGLGKRSFV